MSDTSTTDKVVIGGALVGGLLFFGFLTNTCTSPFSMGDSDTSNNLAITTTNSDANTSSNDDARVAELQKQMDALKVKKADLLELRKDNKALRTEIVSSTKSHREAQALLNKKIQTLQNRIDSTSAATNVSPEPNPAAMNEHDSARLKSKISELTSELELNKAKNQNLTKQLSAMAATPDPKPANTDQNSPKVTALENSLKDLKARNVTLATKLHKLDAQLKMANADNPGNNASDANVKQLTDNLAAKNAEVIKLNAQINQFKAQKTIFAKSTDDLPKPAQTLFADLKTLEGQSAEEVTKAYLKITEKNNSEAKARIKFPSGSSDLTSADKAKIAALTQAAGDNSYFLIVGYADKTGSAAANQKLSSARSTSVAKELATKAKGFQATQAVYLGQTDRFGPASENRVVEIWEIK